MEMTSALVKDAVIVRKSLLGYMGDRHMSFRETLAQNILMIGLDKPNIRDEVYLQVGKAGNAAALWIMIIIPMYCFCCCCCCHFETFILSLPTMCRIYWIPILVRHKNIVTNTYVLNSLNSRYTTQQTIHLQFEPNLLNLRVACISRH